MKRSLRICIVGSAQSIHIKRWAKFFIERNHEVHILSVYHDHIDGAKMWKLVNKKYFGDMAYILSLPKVYQILRKLNPNIIHFHYLGGCSIFSLVVTRCAIISSPWGSDIYTLQNPIKQTIVKMLLEKSHKILTTSRHMAETVAEKFKIETTKHAINSWGIDLEVFKPLTYTKRLQLRQELNIPQDAFVIFSNRTLAPLYRTELILESFFMVKNKSENAFLIVLEGPLTNDKSFQYRTNLKRKAENNDSVKFLHGTISPEMMAKYLQVSDVAISIPTSDQRGASVLEALATGLIVILSSLPVYEDICKEGYHALVLKEATKEALSELILRACTMEFSLKQKLIKINYNIIQQSENWNVQAAKVEAEYYALIEFLNNNS